LDGGGRIEQIFRGKILRITRHGKQESVMADLKFLIGRRLGPRHGIFFYLNRVTGISLASRLGEHIPLT
jgi:hypothetical protein